MKIIPFFREQSLGCFFFLTFLFSKLSWGAGCLGLVEGMSLFIPGRRNCPMKT